MKKPLLLSLLVSVCLICTGQSSATTLIAKNFEDLTREADLIFAGTVTDIHSDWANDEESDIYTYVTFADLEIISGEHTESFIIIRLSGGTHDGRTVIFLGMPEFELGDRDLIFLSGNFVEMCPIVGWGQGYFQVKYDEKLGEYLIQTSEIGRAHV